MAALPLILFIVVPLLELYVLIEVGSEVGALTVIGLLVAAAIAGGLLLRWQGFSLAQRVRETLQRGELPAIEMLEGALVLFAGVLLLLPGFLSDIAAIALLLPWVRSALIRRYVAARGVDSTAHQPRRPHVIEGEFRREDDRHHD
ncbi:MAG: FxsA family protein [Gammaproteobacteria bacterium]|jgi:UPF0716 protein FxsA|nr:FxsA family protein [Gammaproteobacteria bacterium]